MTSTLKVRLVVAGVVVLAVGGVATPFLIRGGQKPAPPGVPPSSGAPAGALTGDVDGDGTADVVTLSRGGRLRVHLGSGASATHLLQDRPRLEGLADIGGAGLAVVVSETGSDHSREWTAWAVRDGDLAALRDRGRGVLGEEPGTSTAWVSGHRLYDGSLDPLQHGVARVVVVSRRWTLQDGVLTGTAAGLRCWDRPTGAAPTTCAPHQNWAFDVGPHGDLPALLPTVRPAWADRSSTSFAGGVWKVRNLDRDVDPEAAPYDLTHTSHGVTHAARVPVGWAPELFGPPVRLADGAPAVLLSQEGGDSDTWRVYVDRGGRVGEVPTRGPVPLGGGFTKTASGEGVVYSWLTPRGRLFTRVGTGQEGRYRVWAWRPTGGDAVTAPTLVAHDLGIVCIDETLGTYGTCS